MAKASDSSKDFEPFQQEKIDKMKKRCGRLEADNIELAALAEEGKGKVNQEQNKNEYWEAFKLRSWAKQCEAFEDYLAAVKDTGKGMFPPGLDKGAKANFRKMMKKYTMSDEGRLLYAPLKGPHKGMCHASIFL